LIGATKTNILILTLGGINKMIVEVNGNNYDIVIVGRTARVNGKEMEISLDEDHITLEGKTFHLDYIEEGTISFLIINGISYTVSRSLTDVIESKEIRAPIGGRVVEVMTEEGQEIKKSDLLIILEAMKMENLIRASSAGRIRQILVQKGQSVKTGDVLLVLE
jgi:biotin carboxyl carrier protein